METSNLLVEFLFYWQRNTTKFIPLRLTRFVWSWKNITLVLNFSTWRLKSWQASTLKCQKTQFIQNFTINWNRHVEKIWIQILTNKMKLTLEIQTQIHQKKITVKIEKTWLQKHLKLLRKSNVSSMVMKFCLRLFQFTWKNSNLKGPHLILSKLTTSDQYWRKYLMVRNKLVWRNQNLFRLLRNQDFSFFENRTRLSSMFKSDQTSKTVWFIYWYFNRFLFLTIFHKDLKNKYINK